jgi:uncharacterized protein (TIRG00374 family)
LKAVRKILKIVLPLAIGLFFIYLSVAATTPSDRKEIFNAIETADYRFVLLSLLCAVLSHLSRAYRWQYLLQPLGYQPRFWNSVFSVMVAYLANLGVPRSGELLRATVLSNYEKFSFEKVFGTVVAERLVDLIVLLIFIFVALLLQFDLIWDLLRPSTINVSMLAVIGALGLFLFIGGFLLLRQNQNSWVIKTKTLLQGFWLGVQTLKKIPHKGAFLLHTVFIWGMYLAMFYVVKWALPDTQLLTLEMIVPAFVAGGLVISATNGGIGIYPFTIALILEGFGLTNKSGLAFGWIMWSSQTLMILLFGGLSFLALPLINAKRSR